MDSMVFEEKLFLRVLVKILANLCVLYIHFILKFIQLLPDYSKALVKFWFYDEFVTIQSIKIYCSFYHLLQFGQTIQVSDEF